MRETAEAWARWRENRLSQKTKLDVPLRIKSIDRAEASPRGMTARQQPAATPL